ncbi:MAG: hypothetical protein HMLKMBBP_00211 [Planctomycetes bacterium]|nr:hypothetical protein [Planctomycetota bacterium]
MSAEAAFGAKLPDVRAGTRDDVRAVLAAELAPFFDRTRMDARSRAAALQWMTLGLFAKYDVAADTVIVVPATIEATAELFGLPWLREPAAAKALLCHEVVHALDARRTKLFDRARAAADGPEMQAVSAVIEGHAQHLGALAAAKLGLEKEFARVTDASSGDAFTGRASESPAVRASAAASRFPYVEGARFVAKIAAERGADGVAALLADPPSDPLWIERPALWTAREATERTRARVAAALRAFDGAMPADLARGGESPSIGALREQLRASGLAADDPCLDRIADTAARTWSERHGFVVAGVLAFDDEESAAAFVALERRLSEARDRAPGAVAATYADGAAGLPGHRARRVPENAPATEVWTVRAGRFVLETSFSGPRFKAAAVEEALRGASAALAAPDGEKTDAPK